MEIVLIPFAIIGVAVVTKIIVKKILTTYFPKKNKQKNNPISMSHPNPKHQQGGGHD